MSNRMLLRRLSFLSLSSSIRPVLHNSLTLTPKTRSRQVLFRNATHVLMDHVRNYSDGCFRLVLSPLGTPKFEIQKNERHMIPRWLSKKKFLTKRRNKKKRNKSPNMRAPRRLLVRANKNLKYASVEEILKDKLERAKMKEAALLERLKTYEVSPAQGPTVKPHELTGEERFYLQKMAKKKANYAEVGTRGIIGGLILNMHLHWKRHETVNIICRHCRPSQFEEYKNVIARLSGGLPIQTIGNHTIVFYRGKDYERPQVMSPPDTLSRKRALEKSKYEQSLESVRYSIKFAEEELELYCRHLALCDDPNNHNPHNILEHSTSSTDRERRKDSSVADARSQVLRTGGAGGLACPERTEVCNIDEDVVNL